MRFLVLILSFTFATANAQCPNCSGVNPNNGYTPQCHYVTVCNQFGQCRQILVC
jgi:hypothetical protein